MKAITTEIIEKRITGWEAKDGKYFKTEEDCKKYEESAECAARCAMQRYVVCDCRPDDVSGDLPWPGDEGNVIGFNIEDENALNTVNFFLDWRFRCQEKTEKFAERLIQPKYIGKVVFIEVYAYDDDFRIMGTEEEIIDSIKDAFKKVLNKESEEK